MEIIVAFYATNLLASITEELVRAARHHEKQSSLAQIVSDIGALSNRGNKQEHTPA